MAKGVLIVSPREIALEPGGIPQGWILDGDPKTASKVLTRTHDWLANMVVWSCSAGSFHWHYNQDEAIMVLSGEAIMTDESGQQKRFGAGDFGFFPAGTSCNWCVPDHFHKVAVLKEATWRPLGLALKVWKKLLRTAGLRGRSPLVFVLAVATLWSHH
jgi:uncharacterized cupin superfamily protein